MGIKIPIKTASIEIIARCRCGDVLKGEVNLMGVLVLEKCENCADVNHKIGSDESELGGET